MQFYFGSLREALETRDFGSGGGSIPIVFISSMVGPVLFLFHSWSFDVVNVDGVDGSSFSSYSAKVVAPTLSKSTGSVAASSTRVLFEVSVEGMSLGPVLVTTPTC